MASCISVSEKTDSLTRSAAEPSWILYILKRSSQLKSFSYSSQISTGFFLLATMLYFQDTIGLKSDPKFPSNSKFS